ncbi:MAG: hypothetical protein WA305_18525, partial [Candidatus Acidiferrales bacterium]
HVASRAHGTEGEHKPAQWGGLDARKTPATGEVFFFLTPFMELNGHWESKPVDFGLRGVLLSAFRQSLP